MIISYTKKELKSVGNYENITIEVMAQDEVRYDDGDDIDLCFGRVKGFVNSKLDELMDEAIKKKELEKQKLTTIKKQLPTHDLSDSDNDSIVDNLDIVTNLDRVRAYVNKAIKHNPQNKKVVRTLLDQHRVSILPEMSSVTLDVFYTKLQNLVGLMP